MALESFRALSERLERFRGRLSIVGTCKNAGKTTVLNFLLFNSPNITSAVSSIGRDGEAYDFFDKHPKPSVRAPAGTLFATSEEALERCRGTWEIEEHTELRTALGRVVIARTGGPCELELAGPTSVAGMREVCERMQAAGAGRVFIDGAFDRTATAAARLSDAVILVAGSADKRNAQEVARQAGSFAARFQLPCWPALSETRALESKTPVCRSEGGRDLEQGTDPFSGAHEQGTDPVSGAHEQGTGPFSGAHEQGTDPFSGAHAAIFRNSLTDDRLPELEGSTVVLPDASGCLVDNGWFWIETGRVRVFVRRQIPLLAVFVNPFRPHLPALSSAELLERTRQTCRQVDVFDLVQELKEP